MKPLFRIGSTTLLFAMLAGLAACNKKPEPPEPPAVKFEITNPQLTLCQGETIVINYTTENTQDKPVWSSSNDAVATVSPTGTVTAITSGNAVITGKLAEIERKCNVQVKPEESSFDAKRIRNDIYLPDIKRLNLPTAIEAEKKLGIRNLIDKDKDGNPISQDALRKQADFLITKEAIQNTNNKWMTATYISEPEVADGKRVVWLPTFDYMDDLGKRDCEYGLIKLLTLPLKEKGYGFVRDSIGRGKFGNRYRLTCPDLPGIYIFAELFPGTGKNDKTGETFKTWVPVLMCSDNPDPSPEASYL